MITPSRWTWSLARVWKRWMVIPLAVLGLGLLGAGVVTFGVAPASAQPAANGFHPEVLAQHSDFPDDIRAQFRIKLEDSNSTQVINVRDAGHVVVVKATFDPGGSAGWHTHPGPAIVVVKEGALTIINASDCVERVYQKGQAFIDPGHGNVHIGFNASETDKTVVYVTFFEVPAGGMATIPADNPGC